MKKTVFWRIEEEKNILYGIIQSPVNKPVREIEQRVQFLLFSEEKLVGKVVHNIE